MSRFEQALDVIDKLDATNQTYIIGHDIPVSISHHMFTRLDAKRKEVAEEIGVPENQYEFEDLVALLTGFLSIEDLKAQTEEMRKRRGE